MEVYDFYITPEEYKIAESNGICPNTLEKRIRWYGWDKKKAVGMPPIKHKRIAKHLVEEAQRNGIGYNTLRYRLNRGWNTERAVTEPVMSFQLCGKKSAAIKGTKYPIEYLELAAKNGISRSRFRDRVSRLGWTMEKAATKPIMTREEVSKVAREAYFNLYGHSFGEY